MPAPLKLLIGYYIIINIVLFLMMGFDKQRAKKEGWRIAESTLIILGLLGASLGGYLGMFTFRHKTKKTAFYLVYFIGFNLHLIFLYFMVSNFVIF